METDTQRQIHGEGSIPPHLQTDSNCVTGDERGARRQQQCRHAGLLPGAGRRAGGHGNGPAEPPEPHHGGDDGPAGSTGQ